MYPCKVDNKISQLNRCTYTFIDVLSTYGSSKPKYNI